MPLVHRRYEFLYEPDVTHVHPALDRLVFLLEPDGVSLHWMTDGEADGGLPTDNLAAEPANRRGPRPLPLKTGEWNQMELRLAKGELSLVLNGAEIYRRPLEAGCDRLFSLFHYKDRTGVQVRNVVLAGEDWPSGLSEARLANLLAPIDAERDIDPDGLTDAVLGEENLYLGTWQVWQAARELPAVERYSFLRNWVLPDPARGSIVRLYGDFTPSDPAPPVAASVGAAIEGDAPSHFVQSGGDLVVPALDLVAVAKELGRLAELRSLVQTRAVGDANAASAKDALLTLIAIAADDDDEAQQSLAALFPRLKETKGADPEYRRWPAVVAASTAARRPRLRPIAQTMSKMIVDQSRVAGNAAGPRWERIARHMQARGQLAAVDAATEGVPYGGSLPLKQWQTAVHATSASRGGGEPRAHWQYRTGGLTHYPGHHQDYVYFAVPLRGDFEVEAELSTFGWRETSVAYAATTFGLIYDRKRYSLGYFERPRPEGVIDPPLDDPGQWYSHRMTVRNGACTVYANGRKLFEERLPAAPDPWLAFRTAAHFQGEVRNVRVTGAPLVPVELELSAPEGLNAWLAEYYGESVAGDQPHWEKRGEEIFGRKLADAAGARESLLQYHRPLFEDGEISYEFLYQAGEAATAPALDRLAFLLEPSGVDIHWLTDAQYDRSGLSAGNRTTEKENRRGPALLPLKDHEWNQARLTLQGDTVTLQLNGVEVYRRDLEPANQRIFGFYHDVSTEARVRKVVYRGDWAKSLPPLDEQELAVSPVVRAALDPKKAAARFDFDFRGKEKLPPQLRTVPSEAEKYIRRSAEGARIVLAADEDKPASVGYETTFGLRGDFEIVAVYSGLKPKPDPKAWGPGVDLHAALAADNAHLRLERRQREDGQHILQSFHSFDLPAKLDHPMSLLSDPLPAAAGKLKIVRKGSMAYYLFAPYDSDDYRLLDERWAGEADALSADVAARAFSKTSGAEVVIEKISIRAEAFNR